MLASLLRLAIAVRARATPLAVGFATVVLANACGASQNRPNEAVQVLEKSRFWRLIERTPCEALRGELVSMWHAPVPASADTA